jgi:hypothetical protein
MKSTFISGRSTARALGELPAAHPGQHDIAQRPRRELQQRVGGPMFNGRPTPLKVS